VYRQADQLRRTGLLMRVLTWAVSDDAILQVAAVMISMLVVQPVPMLYYPSLTR
jgi:hypothetical protein